MVSVSPAAACAPPRGPIRLAISPPAVSARVCRRVGVRIRLGIIIPLPWDIVAREQSDRDPARHNPWAASRGPRNVLSLKKIPEHCQFIVCASARPWSLPLCAVYLLLHDPVEALVGRLLVVEPLGIG